MADVLDGFNKKLGKVLSYLVIGLVIAQFAIVVMSANFQIGSIKLQESLLYMNALMFLGAAGYVLLMDDHVRVDIFYHNKSERFKTWTNLLGHLILLMPFMVFVWIIGIPYVSSSLANLEGSYETSGMQFVYVLKSFFLLLALTLSLQGISGIIRSVHSLKGGA